MEGKYKTVVINESKLESKMHTSDDFVNTKDKITGFAHYAEEELSFGDTLGSPLICEDDTPGACDALVSGSNESESLTLSRVHHSRGSTP
ncbi:hypothetical protein K1719_025876 [Acacia pycnantha]|nr:hypothetical protein K1719_025876 [Acacia pycnantha]